MVNIIMGLKGSGKTKKLVNLVREAVNEGTGDVVVIEKERKLTFDIPYQARLIDAGSSPTISPAPSTSFSCSFPRSRSRLPWIG